MELYSCRYRSVRIILVVIFRLEMFLESSWIMLILVYCSYKPNVIKMAQKLNNYRQNYITSSNNY